MMATKSVPYFDLSALSALVVEICSLNPNVLRIFTILSRVSRANKVNSVFEDMGKPILVNFASFL